MGAPIAHPENQSRMCCAVILVPQTRHGAVERFLPSSIRKEVVGIGITSGSCQSGYRMLQQVKTREPAPGRGFAHARCRVAAAARAAAIVDVLLPTIRHLPSMFEGLASVAAGNALASTVDARRRQLPVWNAGAFGFRARCRAWDSGHGSIERLSLRGRGV
jgi:hypothetical protein